MAYSMSAKKDQNTHILKVLNEYGLEASDEQLKTVKDKIGFYSEEDMEDELEIITNIFKEAKSSNLDLAIEQEVGKKVTYMKELRRVLVKCCINPFQNQVETYFQY